MHDIFSDRNNLLNLGFEEEEEATSDSSRWVWYKKTIPIKDSGYYIQIIVTYLLSISDLPNVKYTDNLNYYFENLNVNFCDKNNNVLSSSRHVISRLEELDSLNLMLDK